MRHSTLFVLFNYVVALILLCENLGAIDTPTNIIKAIPKLIFKSSKDKYSELNVKFHDIFNSTLMNNPQFSIIYVDNKELEQFIARFYPLYLNSYHSLIPGAYKADLFRYLILYRYGGIYNAWEYDMNAN